MIRILVLPGIGDIYWVMTMLEDFIKKNRIRNPVVYVWDFDGRQRSAEYVERIPFVKSGGYFVKPPHPNKLREFRRSYYTGEQSVFPGLFGFNYYIAVNGALRNGVSIQDATGYRVNWYPEMRRTPAEIVAERRFVETFGKYVLLHFSAFGMFREWVKAWPLEHCIEFINGLQQRVELPLLLSGCEWDTPFSEALHSATGATMLSGSTDPDQFFGLLHGAHAVAGWCGGNTILATTLKKPTLMLWSDFFPNERFFYHACPPDAWDKWYVSRAVERISPSQAVTDFCRLIGS